jgi:pimeloyl-ACP methyl ester carboxylesterase
VVPKETIGSIESLPSRFRGWDGPPTRYRLKVDRVVRDIVLSNRECRVVKSNGTAPDTEIHTDAETWLALDGGRLSGIEAFADRKLVVRGSIERSLHFETAFERPDRGGLRYSIEMVKARRNTISTLIAGNEDSPPLLLIHGLGATKASWLTVVGRLAKHHRVIAVDMPGFGASSKPVAPYDAPWFANQAFNLLDALGIDEAFVAGNSMGGRISMEMAMRHPERVHAIACLCPAAAFVHRPALRFVRFLRPELGALARVLPRKQLYSNLRQLFADPSCVHETWYEAAIDDFLATWRSARARVAFLRSLRNIYLDEPLGDEGFWTRLASMETPAMYIYGQHDGLITHRFANKVRETLPDAKVNVWKDCGHVPQIEFPERTAKEMLRFFRTAGSAELDGRTAARL